MHLASSLWVHLSFGNIFVGGSRISAENLLVRTRDLVPEYFALITTKFCLYKIEIHPSLLLLLEVNKNYTCTRTAIYLVSISEILAFSIKSPQSIAKICDRSSRKLIQRNQSGTGRMPVPP